MSFISPSNPLPPIESGSETEGENSSATTAPPAHPSFPRPPHTAGVPNPRLPSSWSASSGANSAFPKDADEKLKGELNFVPWLKLFLGAVEYIGCKDILSGRIPCPEPTTDEYIVWNTMNSFLNIMLCRCIHPSMIPSISKMTSACEAYNFIARTHGPQGSASLKEHLNNFESALMSIRLAGHTVDEGFASAILVTTLPDEEGSPGSWHQWISNFKITSRTTIASTSAKIMGAYRSAHPEEGGDRGSSSSPNVNVESAAVLMERAFAAQGKFYCTNCHTKGHSRDYCRQPGGGKHIPGGVGNGKKKGKKGKEKAHLVDSGGGGDTEQPSSTNFVSLSDTNAIDFSAYPASNLPASLNPLQPISESVYPAGTTADRPPIIIDSGTTSHIHCVHSDFTSYHPAISQKVTGFGSGTMKIAGRGIAVFLARRRCNMRPVRLSLKDTACVPDLSPTLISVSRLDEAKCYTIFGNGKCVSFAKNDAGAC
ncbi:hypothetical protein DFH05DRAFT_1525505 [Lentinula detonsa]|uniref:Retrovirus-related Pol polyprotein from transposon TNT 1-94-like beta-barrel domain-containing protein n=1 Tax=Lentinula detonsa TaxID=2804962 RepID=A0A9W8P0C1_9AGAR|nr:hypothetical protein DFH05DRAFT_1525505 [Lentinula detonsa]